MWWQWGLGLCMIAFIGTAAYVVWFLHQALAGIKRTEMKFEELQSQALRTAERSERMVNESMKLIDDLQSKLKSTDDWFAGVKEAGESLRRTMRIVNLLTSTVEETVVEARRALHSRHDTIRELIDWASLGFQLFSRFQTTGQSKNKE